MRVVVRQPNNGAALYRIVTRRTDLGDSITESMGEVRRLYEAALGRRRADA
jgi:hypothetical protein